MGDDLLSLGIFIAGGFLVGFLLRLIPAFRRLPKERQALYVIPVMMLIAFLADVIFSGFDEGGQPYNWRRMIGEFVFFGLIGGFIYTYYRGYKAGKRDQREEGR